MSFKVKDHYFKKAKREKFFARSIYKLEEIDQKYRIFRKGDLVLDLGYYPGSWIQYSSKMVGESGTIIGIDIQDIKKELATYQNVQIFQKDIFEVRELEDLGVDKKFSVICSDMAPSTTGIKSVDQARSLSLVEKVFELSEYFLKTNGNLVVKVFDSSDAQEFLKKQRVLFKEWHLLKPKSTRSVSKEFFVIGKGFKA